MDKLRAPHRALVQSLPIVAGLAFAFHLAWEVIQCCVFFVHLALPPTWAGMVQGTRGDVALTIVANLVVAIGMSDVSWHLRRPWHGPAIVILELFAFAIAVAVERLRLDMGRWTYAGNAPILAPLGASVVPVLQLVLRFPATFHGAAALTRRIERVPSHHAVQDRNPL